MKNALKYIVFTFFIAASAFYFTSCDIINGGKSDDTGDGGNGDGGSVSIDFLDDLGVKSGKPAGTPLTNVGLTSANIDAITAITGSARAAAAGYYGYYVEDETLLLFFTGITETTRNNVVTFLKSNIGSSNFQDAENQEGYQAEADYGAIGEYYWRMLYSKKDMPAEDFLNDIPKGKIIPKGTMVVAFGSYLRNDSNRIIITGITGNPNSVDIFLCSNTNDLSYIIYEAIPWTETYPYTFVGNLRQMSGSTYATNDIIGQDYKYWKGSGSYYLLLDFDESDSHYIYTDGKTLTELGISSKTDFNKLPKYDITTTVSTIAFNKFVKAPNW